MRGPSELGECVSLLLDWEERLEVNPPSRLICCLSAPSSGKFSIHATACPSASADSLPWLLSSLRIEFWGNLLLVRLHGLSEIADSLLWAVFICFTLPHKSSTLPRLLGQVPALDPNPIVCPSSRNSTHV